MRGVHTGTMYSFVPNRKLKKIPNLSVVCYKPWAGLSRVTTITTGSSEKRTRKRENESDASLGLAQNLKLDMIQYKREMMVKGCDFVCCEGCAVTCV